MPAAASGWTVTSSGPSSAAEYELNSFSYDAAASTLMPKLIMLSKPFAYVVLRSPELASAELAVTLQQFVRERLAEYKRPRGVAFVPDLPKTATGKLQRFKLRG